MGVKIIWFSLDSWLGENLIETESKRSIFGGQDNELFWGTFKVHLGLLDREARQAVGNVSLELGRELVVSDLGDIRERAEKPGK